MDGFVIRLSRRGGMVVQGHWLRYQKGAMVKYRGSIFIADYWAQSEPGKKPKPSERWALHDELYGTTSSRPSDSMKVISYLPVWRQQENFPYGDATKYKRPDPCDLVVPHVRYNNRRSTTGPQDVARSRI